MNSTRSTNEELYKLHRQLTSDDPIGKYEAAKEIAEKYFGEYSEEFNILDVLCALKETEKNPKLPEKIRKDARNVLDGNFLF